MRLLVCGGREYRDRRLVFECLDAVRPDVVITGDAYGADELAREWARARCVPLFVFFANWHAHGKAAGPIRNRQMLDVGKPDAVMAFPGGKGTANMMRLAREAGVVEVTKTVPLPPTSASRESR